MQKGDLIYAPSGAFLYKLEPMSLLVCGEVDNYYKVFYQGSTWHTLKDVTTLLQRGNNDYQTSRNL